MHLDILLFWFSAGFIFYAFLGYPALLRLLALFVPKRPRRERGDLPSVALLISAYNEQSVIEEKIRNALELRYPRDLLQIVVVSDGSDDATNRIVEQYARQGVVLHYYPGRIGKTRCLNQTIPGLTGEIIVFSDANSLYDPDAIACLVSHFSDPQIGFVTGCTRYEPGNGQGGPASLGLYAALELFTKKMESRIGSCVGADGAIFAVRKRLYRPLGDADINDFVIPLDVVRQGFRGVADERAFCREREARDSRDEFRRQVRITSRTLRALFRHAGLFNPLAHGFFSFALASHKGAKFLAPLFLLLLCCLSVVLARAGGVYTLVLALEASGFLLALLKQRDRRSGLFGRTGSLAKTFLITQAAVLAGWFQFLRGQTYTAWSPAKR